MTRSYRIHATEPTRTSRLDYARELNEEQRAVVTRGEGPALVIAGAGSGKTRTITWRVAWLIEQGVPPASILLMTFTNKAAREMLSRVDSLLGGSDASHRVMGGTFHHVGNVLLRRHADQIGFSKSFSILDPEDRNDLLQSVVGECSAKWKDRVEFAGKDALTERRFPQASVIGSLISDAINRQKNFSDVLREQQPWFEPIAGLVQEVAVAFAKRKRERQLMDFDDLLLHWKTLLETNESVREQMRDRFRHVLVDEYQDTNKLQADIIDAIGAPSGNVMVVGDDCQSIYSFRGAHFANIMEFSSRYPGCSEHRLETNYRSTPEILNLANRVIEVNANQFPKVLRASRPSGDKPGLVPARDPKQQAEFVAQRILELRDQGTPLAEIAVLYRNHAHSLEVQVEMARRGIPFEVRSGLRFFERAHVKDVLCHLRIVSNPMDEVAWIRVVRLFPKIGTATAERIWRFVAGAADGAEITRRFADPSAEQDVVPAAARASWTRIRETWNRLADPRVATRAAEQIAMIAAGDYADSLRSRFTDASSRLEDLERLASFAASYPDTGAFLAEVTLLTELADDDGGDPDPESKVTLSTVHRAKGLEWGAVFVIWSADGQFPSVWGQREEEGLEEERRLFYVAMTRAKNELSLVYPASDTKRDGRAIPYRPSRFLADLAAPVPYEWWKLEDDMEIPR